MNQRARAIFIHGYHEAAAGAGLSDNPYRGADGDLWRSGALTWLDECSPARGGREGFFSSISVNPYQDVAPALTA